MSLCFIPTGRAEIIDRIVAVVEGRIITSSDLRQEREMRALLGDSRVDDDATLTKLLADNALIERQIADYPNIDLTDDEVDAYLSRLDPSTAKSDALRMAVRRRLRVQKFFDMRFRQSIRPSDDQIRKYYDEVFVPEARKRLQSIPPLTDPEIAAAVRENVIQEAMDHEVEVWLEAIRRRSNVESFE